MPKIQKVIGVGASTYDLFPVPVLAQRAPVSTDTNYEKGQLWVDESVTPNAVYTHVGGGDWDSGGNQEATTTTPGIVLLDEDVATGATNDTVPTTLAVKTYVDGVAIAGAPVAEEAVYGIGEIATDAEAVAGTANNPGVTALLLTPSNLSPVFASPPAIGGTTPAGGAFTTLSASGAFSLSGDQVQVAEGGTGASTLTDHGILLGSGTAAVSVTAVGTNNQVLIGQSGADPIWTTNLDLPGTLDVTGATTLDDTLDVVGVATFANVDIDNININGNTISSTDTNGNINLTPDGTGVVAATELTLTTDLAVAHGGTGASTDADARTNLGLVIGTDVQAWDAALDDIAGLAVTDGNFIVGDGANWVAESGATVRTSLGLGSIATQDANNVTISGGSITGITDLVVADGGTGASTLTDHGVLVGSGTDPITALTVGTNGQVLVGSTGADPAFATLGSANSSISYTTGAGTLSLDVAPSYLQTASVTIATGDVLTLATTPVQLVAAPAAGSFIEFISAQLILDYNSVAYTEAGDNLVIRYTDGSGVIVSQDIEMTGFIDQSADTITNALPKIDAIAAASGSVGQALVLDNTGSNFGAGNSPLIVKVTYRVIVSGL